MRAVLRWVGYKAKEPHGVAWERSDRESGVEKIRPWLSRCVEHGSKEACRLPGLSFCCRGSYLQNHLRAKCEVLAVPRALIKAS